MSREGSSRGSDSGKAPIGKIRRGRQPRPSTLSAELHQTVRTFAEIVGSPRVIQPGGFRDFSGWLDSLTENKYEAAWQALTTSFIREVSTLEARKVRDVKMDVVKGIINLVVKQQPGESSKLVSTNARRQCARPNSGNTVMKIFESYLALYNFEGDNAVASGSGIGSSQAGPSSSPSAGRGESRGGGSSSMGISSLLIQEHGTEPRSGQRRQLPSISQLDEQLRARSEKERKRNH